MLAQVKVLIDEHGLDEYKKRVKKTSNVDDYVRSYHKHSFVFELKKYKNIKKTKPNIIINQNYMKITLTGLEQGEPVSLDGIDTIVVDLRNHVGGNMYDGIKIMQNIYGDTTMFFCKKWYSLQNGEMIFDDIGKELAFKGKIIVLVSNKTASSGEILALTFMGRNNTTISRQRVI
jgi:C-terminal processing protease CtpA/Prc